MCIDELVHCLPLGGPPFPLLGVVKKVQPGGTKMTCTFTDHEAVRNMVLEHDPAIRIPRHLHAKVDEAIQDHAEVAAASI